MGFSYIVNYILKGFVKLQKQGNVTNVILNSHVSNASNASKIQKTNQHNTVIFS